MTQSTDRLDRIEALLESSLLQHNQEMAEIRAGLRETRAITESNARAIEAWGDRIEEGIAEAEEVTSQQTANLAVRIEDNTHNQGIDRVRFDALHEEHSQRFNNLLEEARADRVRADQRHEEQTQQFNNLLEEARADRVRFDQLHTEHTQRFDVFLAEARADRADMRAAREQADRDRALNEAEHRAFRETFQTMLAQIAQLWQRVG